MRAMASQPWRMVNHFSARNQQPGALRNALQPGPPYKTNLCVMHTRFIAEAASMKLTQVQRTATSTGMCQAGNQLSLECQQDPTTSSAAHFVRSPLQAEVFSICGGTRRAKP
jgi:hypothetical protein